KLVTLNKSVPVNLDWEGWKRRDWDGQKLLELFHEFGFRGFAERVRKTLAASGAQKNAAALEAAGLPAEAAKQTGEAASGLAGEHKTKGKKKTAPKKGSVDLLSIIGESDEEPAAPKNDGWSYEGYELVDTTVDFDRFLADLKKQKAFVFDLETTGL